MIEAAAFMIAFVVGATLVVPFVFVVLMWLIKFGVRWCWFVYERLGPRD